VAGCALVAFLTLVRLEPQLTARANGVPGTDLENAPTVLTGPAVTTPGD
jgi:hypothetical protein